MPRVKGPVPDPITELSYTAHDPDNWRVTCHLSESGSSSETRPHTAAASCYCSVFFSFLHSIIGIVNHFYTQK